MSRIARAACACVSRAALAALPHARVRPLCPPPPPRPATTLIHVRPCSILGDGDGAPGGGGANASYWCQPNGRVTGAAYFLRQPTGLTAPLPHAPYAAAAANGAVLHYWRPFHWYSAFARVAAAATDRATNLTRLRWSYGGFHGAEGTDVGEDYFIDHVAEELDAPREFYFDAATQTLFYFHNASAGTPPPAGWAFEAPMLHTLVNVSGSSAAPVENITLLGLMLTGAAASFLKPHGLPAGGDWTVARIGALIAEGSVGLTVANCTFARLDGNAIVLNGFNRGATIDASEFTLLGESAVVSWGRVDGADASAGMQPRGTVLSRSLCHEIGLYEKQASCYFATLSGQATVADNIFFNMPRAAVCFNDDAIGGSLVTRNLIFATCRESQDHGPVRCARAYCRCCCRCCCPIRRLPPPPPPPTFSALAASSLFLPVQFNSVRLAPPIGSARARACVLHRITLAPRPASSLAVGPRPLHYQLS